MHFLEVTFQTLMNVFCFSEFKIIGSIVELLLVLIREGRQAAQAPAPCLYQVCEHLSQWDLLYTSTRAHTLSHMHTHSYTHARMHTLTHARM